MDPIQAQHELAVGERLITALNHEEGSAYKFLERGNDAPDLIYSDGGLRLGIEVGTVYYHSKDAELRWKGARSKTDAPTSWGMNAEEVMRWGFEPDANLMLSLQKLLNAKCQKYYGDNCWLLISLYPNLTSWEEFEELLRTFEPPAAHRFKRILIAGTFPFTFSITGEPRSQSAYRVVEIFPSRRLIHKKPVQSPPPIAGISGN
jgi:hypothetical protein